MREGFISLNIIVKNKTQLDFRQRRKKMFYNDSLSLGLCYTQLQYTYHKLLLIDVEWLMQCFEFPIQRSDCQACLAQQQQHDTLNKTIYTPIQLE